MHEIIQMSWLALLGASGAVPSSEVAQISEAVQKSPGYTMRCEKDKWAGQPATNENNEFEGALYTDCEITPDVSSVDGLGKVDQYFLNLIVKGREIHSGPTPEVFETLPSVRYDVTANYLKEGDTMSIRQLARVATDRTSKLTYEVNSTRIDGTGMPGHIRKIHIRLDLKRKEAQPNQEPKFSVRLIYFARMLRPVIAYFVSLEHFEEKAKEAAFENFKEKREELLPQVAKYLVASQRPLSVVP